MVVQCKQCIVKDTWKNKYHAQTDTMVRTLRFPKTVVRRPSITRLHHEAQGGSYEQLKQNPDVLIVTAACLIICILCHVKSSLLDVWEPAVATEVAY